MYEFPITRPVLPEASVYQSNIDRVFASRWLTNRGPLLQELEERLADYLGVQHFMLVTNGTLALHVAYKALGLGQNVITTPYSFAATSSSLVWEGHQCLFGDIDANSLNLSATALPVAMLQQADGIVATHVFGNPCDVTGLAKIAEQHQLKVIYDAAHAFGCQYRGESLLKWGDAATLSLHATKIFHTVEGGAIVFRHADDLARARELINFGFDEHSHPQYIGINAKMSEMHAAMGLSLLPIIDVIRSRREACVAEYQSQLKDIFTLQQWADGSQSNGAYMPILCDSESQLLALRAGLNELGVQTRRYFYPSLSQVDCYGKQGATPVADGAALRSLCLPLYGDLTPEDVAIITARVKQVLRHV